jgi:hypothetical protein
MAQVNSRLEIAKMFLRIVLAYSWSKVKYKIFAFFPLESWKIMYDSTVIDSQV